MEEVCGCVGVGGGILKGRKHLEESGDQKQSLFLIPIRALKRLLDPQRHLPNLF